MPLDIHRLRDFAQRYTAAWCSGNPVAVAALFAPDGSLSVNDSAPAEGRDAIALVARSFMNSFPDLQVVMDALRVVDGRTQSHWALTGTLTTPGGNANKVCVSGFEVWQLGPDGLIASSEGHFDESEYERQLQGK